MARGIQDKKPVLEAMGMQLASITTRSFNDASLRAAPWAPLSARTIAAKIRAGKSTAILKRDVLLARSWRVSNVTNSRAEVSTDRFYAVFHQFGTKRGLPPRPMLPYIGDSDNAEMAPFAREKVESVARKKIEALLKKAGE